MNQVAQKVETDVSLSEQILNVTQDIVDQDLKPLTVDIDLKGIYPENVLRKLGSNGVFQQHLPSMRADAQADMGTAIEAMGVVSQECMSTGFTIWCQDTCAWYIQNAVNTSLKDKWLNTMKAFSGIEELRLEGERVDGGYIVNGSLPWVSNLGEDHVFGTMFKMKGDASNRVMALIDCNSEGFELRLSAHFVALEGTMTYACIFENVFVPDEMVINDDGASFLRGARTGIVLLQTGMGIGNIQGCIDICTSVEPLFSHVNCYLDDRPEELQEDLDDAKEAIMALAEEPFDGSNEYFREVLGARLSIGELALRASQSAMLHAGAQGYLHTAPAQRKMREAYFVAIITPAIKHLRKELENLADAA